jgi:hypothetical protein
MAATDALAIARTALAYASGSSSVVITDLVGAIMALIAQAEGRMSADGMAPDAIAVQGEITADAAEALKVRKQ